MLKAQIIDMMEKDKVALMGWKEDKPLGKKFENDVKLGDIIIISLRVNWERKDYFVGIVDSDSYHYDYQDRYIQARKLKYFGKDKILSHQIHIRDKMYNFESHAYVDKFEDKCYNF